MSDRRRSAAALSSRAHAFSVEALIGTNKKRKLRGWEGKELELSIASLATNGQLGDSEDTAHCLDMDPGYSRYYKGLYGHSTDYGLRPRDGELFQSLELIKKMPGSKPLKGSFIVFRIGVP